VETLEEYNKRAMLQMLLPILNGVPQSSESRTKYASNASNSYYQCLVPSSSHNSKGASESLATFCCPELYLSFDERVEVEVSDSLVAYKTARLTTFHGVC